ncbi:zinc-finger double domain-containing protein [Phthorimaea operculella]|nr:zinc-finger double domain-containing protein [Phthorimaea operculella]
MKYKCEKCVIRIPEKKVEQHAERHNKYAGKTHYTCDYCTLPFKSKELLRSHINGTHRYIRSCNVCSYKCISKAQIYKHVGKEHRPRRAVQCLECAVNFKSTKEFYKHYRREHLTVNIYICDHCGKKCKGRRTMERHIFNNHTTHACPKCPLTFITPSRLKQHYDLKHSVSRTEDSYCVKCDRQFDNVPQFRNHVNSSVAHREERSVEPKKQKHQCPACPKVYAKGCSMKNHYNKVHANNARFHCTDCDKVFLTNWKLKEHIKYCHEGHERERNHVCTICGRGFTQRQVLIKHTRTHTGERPYECPHCESRFAQRTAMLTHIRNIHVKRELKMHGQSQNVYNINV